MIDDHAIVVKDGFRVPLIGVARTAMLEECELCHEQKPLSEIELQGNGQMLCVKCRSETVTLPQRDAGPNMVVPLD